MKCLPFLEKFLNKVVFFIGPGHKQINLCFGAIHFESDLVNPCRADFEAA